MVGAVCVAALLDVVGTLSCVYVAVTVPAVVVHVEVPHPVVVPVALVVGHIEHAEELLLVELPNDDAVVLCGPNARLSLYGYGIVLG